MIHQLDGHEHQSGAGTEAERPDSSAEGAERPSPSVVGTAPRSCGVGGTQPGVFANTAPSAYCSGGGTRRPDFATDAIQSDRRRCAPIAERDD